ncbi:M20/M25/M40 family metallo-hydrolase [Leptolyngbya sp. AN02str]|uniref:M20/M25/M40 family metallo-hydrolase n=1 Tax=Leptolyngbya sp. AN02str TaxID=3423363 RepID=UPI003D30FC88
MMDTETLKRNLHHHLREVVRDRDPFLATAGHFYVQQYLQQQLGQWGGVQAHEFTVKGRQHTNWILTLPPIDVAQQHRPCLVIGAHYDTVPGSPGADDNATGIAVLLELARALQSQGARYPVRLVAFDLEEYGLQGSRAYAAMLHQQRQPIRLMLSLEMLGYCSTQPHSQRYPAGLQRFYPNCGNFIGLIGNWKTILDMRHLRSHILRSGHVGCEWLPAGDRGHLVPDTRRSDHAPFWDLGDRAILVTDTADLRSPHYHKSSDRLDTLNLDFLTGVCAGLIAGIRTLR